MVWGLHQCEKTVILVECDSHGGDCHSVSFGDAMAPRHMCYWASFSNFQQQNDEQRLNLALRRRCPRSKHLTVTIWALWNQLLFEVERHSSLLNWTEMSPLSWNKYPTFPSWRYTPGQVGLWQKLRSREQYFSPSWWGLSQWPVTLPPQGQPVVSTAQGGHAPCWVAPPTPLPPPCWASPQHQPSTPAREDPRLWMHEGTLLRMQRTPELWPTALA